MASLTEIEKELLQLNPVDRARLAVAAWDSIGQDLKAEADPDFDPDGIKLALARDREISLGTPTLDLQEYRRQTGGE